MPPPKDSALPAPDPGALQICTAPCKDNWKPTTTVSAASGWAQTFDYTVRSEQTGDKSDPLRGRIFFISQGTLWSFLGGSALVLTGLVLVWLAGGGESPVRVSARKFLFQIFPDSGVLARVNLPVAVFTSFDVGLEWFLRPVLRHLSGGGIVATDLDNSVASATRKAGPDSTSIVLYDSTPNQAEPHAIAICKIIASEGVGNDGLWRMPLIVRLNELNDGDVKKATLVASCKASISTTQCLPTGSFAPAGWSTSSSARMSSKRKVPTGAILQSARFATIAIGHCARPIPCSGRNRRSIRRSGQRNHRLPAARILP